METKVILYSVGFNVLLVILATTFTSLSSDLQSFPNTFGILALIFWGLASVNVAANIRFIANCIQLDERKS